MVDIRHEIQGLSSKSYLTKLPHHAFPGHTLNKDVDIDPEDDDKTPSFPYQCSLPLPFLPPACVSEAVWEGNDPAVDLLGKKKQWESDIHKQTKYYADRKKKKELTKMLEDIISSDKKIHDVSDRDADYMKLVSSNPDRDFEGMYNWYFTGGCIDTVNVINKEVLITTQGPIKDRIGLIPLDGEKFWKPSGVSKSSQCSIGQSIYQVKGHKEQGLIGVRQHKECCLYSIDSSFQFIHKIHEVKADYPFTGMDLKPRFPEKYVTTKTNRWVQEWDVKAGCSYSLYVNKDEKLPDKWSTVLYSDDPNIVTMTDRNSIHFLDIREQNLSRKISPKKVPNLLDMCEMISLILQSSMRPYAWYVCTTHHVLLYDTRKELKPVQCWTHLMKTPPIYGSAVASQGDEEVLGLANQISGEIITIKNNWNETTACSEIPPLSLPNMQEALESAHLSGVWLEPAVRQRVKFSLTGLVWLPYKSSGLTLLSQNSAGDVFHYFLKPRSEEEAITEKKYLKTESLTTWEKQLLEKRPPAVLHFTRKKSVYKAVKDLRKTKGKYIQDMRSGISKQPWMMSKKEMLSYCDILSQRILDVWEIEDEPEWCASKRRLHNTSAEDVDRVQAWLESVPLEDKNISLNSEDISGIPKVTPHKVSSGKYKSGVCTSTPLFKKKDPDLDLHNTFSQDMFQGSQEVSYNEDTFPVSLSLSRSAKKRKEVLKNSSVPGF